MTKNFTTLEDYIKNNLNSKELNQVKISEMQDIIAMDIMDYRHKNNMSQSKLAKLANIPQSSVVRVENGDNTGDITLMKIAAVMNKKLEFV